MDRTMPIAQSEEIELYIRTYYSLLRSSGPIRVRSLEDTHAAMNSSLHHGADHIELDVTALTYSALRLPEEIAQTSFVIMGQMEDVFAREGYPVREWARVRARARRRKFYFDAEEGHLAAYIASVSDIDDLIPILTAFQIEWNKLHRKLLQSNLPTRLHRFEAKDGFMQMELLEVVRETLGLDTVDFTRLAQLWPGERLTQKLQQAAQQRLDLHVTVLGSGLSDYRRSVQTWWRKVETVGNRESDLAKRPIYFVSSNTHSLINALMPFDEALQQQVIDFVQRENPEDLWREYQNLSEENVGLRRNFLYYALGVYLQHPSCPNEISQGIEKLEREAGIVRISDSHSIDVEAQLIDLSRLDYEEIDPRLLGMNDEEIKLLRESNALIFNIDYPLGMAAYHLFSQVSTAANRILGVYILGKAATLNGRVGDVMIPNVVYDEHSRNSYLFRNCFTAQDVAPLLSFGTVFDNQKAVTVRGTLLQNREFMHVFYEEGYTDIEMEAGPYLSGLYEDIYPRRYPIDEIVNLFINAPYDIGLIHYASDTPISRRQSLLSKSLSYFGVDATYATSVAVLRRIFQQEVERRQRSPSRFGQNGTAQRGDLRAVEREAELADVVQEIQPALREQIGDLEDQAAGRGQVAGNLGGVPADSASADGRRPRGEEPDEDELAQKVRRIH